MTKRGTATSPGQQTAERPWERKRPISQPPQQSPVNPTLGTWEKLLETDLYELYARNYEKGWCFEGSHAWLRQVFKVGEDFVLVNDDTYTERFEREILPLVKARCNQLKTILVFNYIKGVRIDYPSLKESTEVQEIPGGNRRVPDLQDKDGSLSQTEVRIDYYGHHKYFMYGYESLLDLRTPRPEPESQAQAIAKYEEVQDRWKKRADEAYARKRATEEAAEQKLAAMNRTGDGQLNLSGIDNEHKRLFLMIYDGNFLDLLEREDIQDLPLMMYRGMIMRNDKLCHDFLSRNAVTVEETWERLDHIDTNFLAGIVTEHYVKEKLIITMEPQYRNAFKFASNKNFKDNYLDKLISALTDPDQKINHRRNPIESGWAKSKPFRDAMNELVRKIEKSKSALSQLLPRESCGKPGTVRFMDNMTRYVTNDYSKERPPSANGTYPYIEKIGGVSGRNAEIERFYENVPPTFSPDFPVPEEDEHIWIWINKNAERQALRSVSIKKFGLTHLTADRSYTSIMLPSYVRQALQEKKYSIAHCEYLVSSAAAKNLLYWNANGPLPPESVQTFAKKTIFAPRTSCPVNVPSRN
ncbi:MAG: hypothetical protein P0119_16725 [Nitrospira sp.]|nr:hypothetical protein [Nitrospira sp.]